jgi:phosphopentomutase
MFKRGFLIVLDSVGVGELPDADTYGDKGANTLGHIDQNVDFLSLPNLEKLGLGNIISLTKVKKQDNALAAWGKSMEKSPGKDTITGHWEIAGLILKESFPTYPNGFPEELIKKVEEVTGYKVIGNKPASGTEIIKELGEEHIKTKKLIVYTSADSVFQIAAHEEIVPVEELYEICKKVREILVSPHNIARVIARPFIGEPGNFTRTPRRHDFSILPPRDTMLDILSENGYLTYGVGKIKDIFGGKGIKEYVYTESNLDGIKKTIKLIEEEKRPGLIFTNLVDFDMLYGHRNNGEGYARALMEFDSYLPVIMDSLQEDDFLIITADHGCDPYHEGTDHTREHIPILIYGKKIENNINIGVRNSYADIGKTILELFNIFETKIDGKSFANEIIKNT